MARLGAWRSLCSSTSSTSRHKLFDRQRWPWADYYSEPLAGPTVVVTHHAPHRGSLAQRYADDWASGALVTELAQGFFDMPVL